uniref:Uncharacterized protein n=1 Tax=Anguilla anguilla TaxID=7936 RepID=A0A0E9QFG0_ANGAN
MYLRLPRPAVYGLPTTKQNGRSFTSV